MEHFWQNFPKAIAVEGRAIELHLFPPQDLDLHEIQGGEQKTHTFHLALGAETISASPLEWVRRSTMVHVDSRVCGIHRRNRLSGAQRRCTRHRPSGADSLRRRGRRHIRGEARDHRRVRLAAFRRRVRRPRGRPAYGPDAARLALQQPVRSDRRLRDPVPPERRPALVAGDARAGVARRRHRHLPHGSRQGRVQPRPLLAHRSLRRCRHRHPPHLPIVVRARRRPRQRAELCQRSEARMAAHRRKRPSGMPRSISRNSRSESTTVPGRSFAGSLEATRAWRHRPATPCTTVRAAARATR